jgi:hypothetical protein
MYFYDVDIVGMIMRYNAPVAQKPLPPVEVPKAPRVLQHQAHHLAPTQKLPLYSISLSIPMEAYRFRNHQ